MHHERQEIPGLRPVANNALHRRVELGRHPPNRAIEIHPLRECGRARPLDIDVKGDRIDESIRAKRLVCAADSDVLPTREIANLRARGFLYPSLEHLLLSY